MHFCRLLNCSRSTSASKDGLTNWELLTTAFFILSEPTFVSFGWPGIRSLESRLGPCPQSEELFSVIALGPRVAASAGFSSIRTWSQLTGVKASCTSSTRLRTKGFQTFGVSLIQQSTIVASVHPKPSFGFRPIFWSAFLVWSSNLHPSTAAHISNLRIVRIVSCTQFQIEEGFKGSTLDWATKRWLISSSCSWCRCNWRMRFLIRHKTNEGQNCPPQYFSVCQTSPYCEL